MSLLNNDGEAKRKNAPTESCVIEEFLQADLWVSEKGRISWCLSRCKKDDTRGYRTLLPQHVGESVKGVELLSRVFAQADTIDASIRDYCKRLSTELQGVSSRMGRVPMPEVAKPSNLLSMA